MLKFLGRGSAFNVKEGNTSAYIKEGNFLFLLDCGEGIFKEVLDKKLLDGVEVVNIFISHLNSDHVGSLSSLLFYLKYKTNIYENTSIVCGEKMEKDLNSLLEINGNTDANVVCGEKYNWIEMLKNGELILKEVSHIDKMNCYGIIFKHNDKIGYYSGDSNNIPKEILKNIDKIDYIYQDTCLADYKGNVHMSLKALCDIFPKEHRHKIWCMHLDCDELIERAKDEGFNVVELEGDN